MCKFISIISAIYQSSFSITKLCVLVFYHFMSGFFLYAKIITRRNNLDLLRYADIILFVARNNMDMGERISLLKI